MPEETDFEQWPGLLGFWAVFATVFTIIFTWLVP